MKAINIAKTQAKGLINLMLNAKNSKNLAFNSVMIHGLRGSYSTSLFSIDKDGFLIRENSTQMVVDIIKN